MVVVGLFGCGTVGGGVINLLRNTPGTTLKHVVVKNPQKKRDVELPINCGLSSNPDDILEDKQINCVVEVMGGTGIAWDITQSAIKKGKHVVTANKALISKYLDEICQLLQTHPCVHFQFEAAVCGGIPIINAVRRAFKCDRIFDVGGIMNGTTNFILTKMAKEGLPYSTVLREAQEKGYAEMDPSADVEGWDARSKLCILSKLAFGLTIDEELVFCQGIARVDDTDFAYAKIVEHTIKLMSVARLEGVKDGHGGGERVVMFVSPFMVPVSHPVSSIDGATNFVGLHSVNLGHTSFVGPGAGRRPTANSIVADILEIANLVRVNPNARAEVAFPNDSTATEMNHDFVSAFYLRIVVDDGVGIVQQVSQQLAEEGISIFSILQTPITDPHNVAFAIITEECRLSQMQKVCERIKQFRSSFLLNDPFYMPYMP